MMLDGEMSSSFWLGLYVFHGMSGRQGTGSKAEWQTLSSLFGQNHVMTCVLPKCGGGKNAEVLKNQSPTSAVTLRMEKDQQGTPKGDLIWSRKKRSNHLRGVCAFGVETGLFVALPLGSLIQAPPFCGREKSGCQ